MEIINGIDQDDIGGDVTEIDGATIDNSVIGGITPAAGSFTVLKASTDPVDANGVGDRGFNDNRYCLESNNLSDVDDAATSFGNIKQAATDSITGVSELSTDAEVVTGTATDRVTTPANITAKMSAPGAIGDTTPAAGSFTTLTSTTNKLDATVTPTINDDIDLGYIIGSRWMDIIADKEYVCLDNSDGAAVWIETTIGSSDVSDDTSPQLGGNLDMGTYNLVGEGGSTGVYIDSDGQVGVGTNTPGHPLDVQCVGTSGVNITGATSSAAIIRMGGAWTLSRDTVSTRLDGGALPVNLTGNVGTVRASYKHTVSSVNYIEYTGSVTGSGLVMAAAGSDSNIDMTIKPKGTGNIGIGANNPTAMLDIDSDILRLRTAKTPATAGANGNQGDIAWDANYFYVCVSTNTWKRSALSTW